MAEEWPDENTAVDQLTSQVSDVKLTAQQPPDALYGSSIQTKFEGSPYRSESSWQALFGGKEELLNGISAMGWTRPSQIQGQALPQVIRPGPDGKYRNLKAQAHHGSGKTGTYVLAMLSRCDLTTKSPQAVCVCPTRELAQQVAEVACALGKFMTGLEVFCAVPPKKGEIEHKGPITAQIIVGTPGAIKFQIRRSKALNTRTVSLMVIDEADEMLKKGGLSLAAKDIKRAFGQVQVLLFSATFPERNEKKISQFLGTRPPPYEILIRAADLYLENVHHFYIDCIQDSDDRRLAVLEDIYDVATEVGQSVIFLNTKLRNRKLYDQLLEGGYAVDMLDSSLSPRDRDAVMEKFRDRKTSVLIATDIIGRGIDVPAVKMVVNYDIPYHHDRPSVINAQSYIHRIGRAGRFGVKGVGINLITTQQQLKDVKMVCEKYNIDLRSLPSLPDEIEEFAKVIQGHISPTDTPTPAPAKEKKSVRPTPLSAKAAPFIPPTFNPTPAPAQAPAQAPASVKSASTVAVEDIPW